MKNHQLPLSEFKKMLQELSDRVLYFNEPQRMENLNYRYKQQGITFGAPSNPRMRRGPKSGGWR